MKYKIDTRFNDMIEINDTHIILLSDYRIALHDIEKENFNIFINANTVLCIEEIKSIFDIKNTRALIRTQSREIFDKFLEMLNK